MDTPCFPWLGQSRASRPKVKTGCLPCKQRHVKCPGQKPTCMRCEKAARSCEYANDGLQHRPAKRWPIRFKPDAWSLHSAPSSKRFKNEAERRGFEYFESTSASALGFGLGWPAWGQFILQNSEHNLVLHHATIALGAIHEHELKVSRTHQSPHIRQLLTFAFCQYDSAIRQLRMELQLQRNISQEQMMLACIVFTIFDFVQGDDLAAAVHLQGGLKILRNFVAGSGLLNRIVTFREHQGRPGTRPTRPRASRDCAQPLSHLENLPQKLTKLFTYLDFWSLMWSNGEPLLPEVSLIEGLTIEPTVDDKEELDFIMRYFGPLEIRIHEFQRAAKARTNSGNDDTTLDTSFSNTKQDLLDRLSTWHRKLSDLYAAQSDHLSDDQKLRAQVLTLNYKKSRIMLLACKEEGGSEYQTFDSAFQDIIATSTPMINNAVANTSRSQVFSFVPGVIHPLYITATCCCDVTVCVQAIRLLESTQWTEGVWNSATMAKIARRKLDERPKWISCPTTP